MGIPIMIMGESGSGKSTSLRNFKNGEIAVINVSKKLLPFKANFGTVDTDNYKQIRELIKQAKSKSICIDDATYLLVNEFMRTVKVSSFSKYNDMASNFWELIQCVVNELPKDKLVYFMGHIERDTHGNEKFKTIGKLLDEKITLEGLFTIVLKTQVKEGNYTFTTQTNGSDTVKSPIGLFPAQIENDLRYVDQTIRQYYGLN